MDPSVDLLIEAAAGSDLSAGVNENIIRKKVSIGIDGRPIRGSKNSMKGSKNRGSSNQASTSARPRGTFGEDGLPQGGLGAYGT